MANNAKIALITGGNKGLGFEMARQLGQKGVTVVLGARDAAKGEAAATALRKEGINASAVQLDVTSAADREAAAAQIGKTHGRLDILINNAGIALESFAAGTSKASGEKLRATFETNFFSQVAVTQAMLPLLEKSDAGRIVNMSSILGSQALHADPKSPIYNSKSLAYDASKAALNSFTIHLAHELRGTKIKVNSAHPGWVKTDMGTSAAPMEVVDGAKTGVELALLGEDGPTGGYFHMGSTIPW